MPSSISCCQAADEVGADEARLARDLGARAAAKVGLGGRVAVDRDQRSGRADALRDEAGVTAAAQRAVDGDLAGARVKRLDQLTGENRDVRLGHVKKCGQGTRSDQALAP